MAETLENQILHALGQVFDDDKDKNIVSLGIVKNINVVWTTRQVAEQACFKEFISKFPELKENSLIFMFSENNFKGC